MNDKASSDSHRWIVLGVVVLGSFTSILTSSMVNVTMPRIMTTFGINREQVEWISTSFMLASAVAMPMVGWMVGRFGHKAFYLGALAVFTVGTAACSLAWNYNTLIAARVIQAVGGGAMQPAGMAMVATLFAPEERGRAMGVWATGVMVGPALGPTVGGYMTEWFGWRSVFTMNLPFAFVTLLFGAAAMKDDPSIPRIRNPFDWWGFLFLAMALIGGLLAFSEGQERGWTSEYIVTCAVIGIVGITMFLAVEATIRYPLLDLRIFKYWNYSVTMVLSIFRSVGLFGGMFFFAALSPESLRVSSGKSRVVDDAQRHHGRCHHASGRQNGRPLQSPVAGRGRGHTLRIFTHGLRSARSAFGPGCYFRSAIFPGDRSGFHDGAPDGRGHKRRTSGNGGYSLQLPRHRSTPGRVVWNRALEHVDLKFYRRPHRSPERADRPEVGDVLSPHAVYVPVGLQILIRRDILRQSAGYGNGPAPEAGFVQVTSAWVSGRICIIRPYPAIRSTALSDAEIRLASGFGISGERAYAGWRLMLFIKTNPWLETGN